MSHAPPSDLAPAAADPIVSIVIPVFNKWEYTAKCLEMLSRNTAGHPYEVVVVDNASSDGTRAGLAAWPALRVQRNRSNLGFAKACNQGARMARGKYLLFLNNDTEPLAGWLEPLVRILDEEPEVAIVGSRLLFPDGTLQHAGVEIASAAPLPISPQHIDYRRPASRSTKRLELDAVTGACFIIRRQAFFAAGGFDEGYVNGCEDIDLCLTVKAAGGRVVYTPESTLVHHESVSDGRFLYVSENMVRFHQRWMDRYPGFAIPVGEAPGAGRDPAAPAVSLVLVVGDALSTIAPCLESLARFAGPQDEIVIVDDASADGTERFMDSFRGRLPGEVRLIRHERAEGFARSANEGLALATRPYALLLRPEAILTPGCLERLVTPLERAASVGAVGPRSDRVEGPQKAALTPPELGFDRGEAVAASLARRFAGRSRETKLLEDFCLLVRRDALAAVGGLDPEIGAACHDLDLSLRLREAGYGLRIAEDAFVRHFGPHRLRDRNGVRREYQRRQSVNLLHGKLWRAFGGRVPDARELWGIESFQPQAGRVSVVVPVRESLEAARQCAAAVLARSPRDLELVLVDDGSEEPVTPLAEELRREHPDVVLVRSEESEGYAAAVNRGLAAARGEFVALLHSDVVVTEGWLSRLLALLSIDPRLGVVGPRASAAPAPQGVDSPGYADLAELERFAADWALCHSGELAVGPRVSGMCMVMRREVVDVVGGMDPAFGPGGLEDEDFCLRALRAGFKAAVAGDVYVHHYGGLSFRAAGMDAAEAMRESAAVFRSKWDLPTDLRQGYPAERLAAARPFDPARDRVPLEARAALSPQAPPLDLGEAREVRLLCFPDAANPSWKQTLSAYLRAFASGDPVSLVLRVEPPLPERVEAALAEARGCLAAAGISEEAMPDVVFEASSIPPAARGGLYTAVSALLPVAGSRASLYLREAAACGLPVIDPATPERLRDSVAGLRGVARELAAAG